VITANNQKREGGNERYCIDAIRTPDFSHLSMPVRVKILAGLRHGLSPASTDRESGGHAIGLKRGKKGHGHADLRRQ
jgi:hypothetical protein